jgi:hypothetical protein
MSSYLDHPEKLPEISTTLTHLEKDVRPVKCSVNAELLELKNLSIAGEQDLTGPCRHHLCD